MKNSAKTKNPTQPQVIPNLEISINPNDAINLRLILETYLRNNDGYQSDFIASAKRVVLTLPEPK